MHNKSGTKTLVILSIVGFLVFFLVNWGSLLFGEVEESELTPTPSLSKQNIATRAIAFMEDNGLKGPWNAFVMFQSDTLLSGYLQKNELDHAYIKQFNTEYPIDFFQVELTHETTEERYLVNLNMKSGAILGWTKVGRAGPVSREQEQAALSYLEQQGFNQAELVLASHRSEQGEFVFQLRGAKIGEAQLQVHTYVGDQGILGYIPKFSIPASHLDWQNNQELSMAVMSFIALLLQVLMGVGAIVLTVKFHDTVSYGRGLLITAIYIATAAINNINMYPAYKTTVTGEVNASAALWFNLIFSHSFVFITGVFVYLSLVSGQAAWKSINRNLWARWHEADYGKHVLSAMGHGYLICFIILGAQHVMFWIAERYFGMWSTNDPLFSTDNLLVPALFPLLAWAAAISEEAVFRLFGIVFFKRILRNTLAAVFLSSMIWAIGHTSYPIYPAYTRFVEVTVLGLIFGWIYLRYGFITAVFAHATVNSLLMAFSLLTLGGALQAMTGLFYIALPALVGWLIYALHSRFGPGHRQPVDPLATR